MYEDVLHFWFDECEPRQWFMKDEAFDDVIRRRFGALSRQAAACELYEWRDHARGRLAEVIVLDQFSRNIHRDTPLAFACDPLSLALAQEALSTGVDKGLSKVERSFLYMPFMHSESPKIHERALTLFQGNGIEENLRFERLHKDIIDRFGRYPHRNRVLGRRSTPEEVEFLKEPGSGF